MTVRESDPERVQIEGVVDAKVMARPDVEVSVSGRVKEPEPKTLVVGAVKEMVWFALSMVIVVFDVVMESKLASPSLVAVMMQLPAPVGIRVDSEMVQLPETLV